MRVRDAFTDLIVNFVRTVVYPNATKTPSTSPSLFGSLQPGPTSSAFIRIRSPDTTTDTTAPIAQVAHDFRYCQLSLWGAKLQADKTESCAFLVDQLAALNSLTNVLAPSGNGKGLLGGMSQPQKPEIKKSGGLRGLGGLL